MPWKRQALSAGSVDRQWVGRKSPSPELCCKLTRSQHTTPYGERLLWRGLRGPCPPVHNKKHTHTHIHMPRHMQTPLTSDAHILYMRAVLFSAVSLTHTHTQSRQPLLQIQLWFYVSDFFQETWMKWHSKSEMSSNPCCLIWGKIRFWQAILDNKDHFAHGRDWCGKWWRGKRCNFSQVDQKQSLIVEHPQACFFSISGHISNEHFPCMSRCCSSYILFATQVYGNLIKKRLPDFWRVHGWVIATIDFHEEWREKCTHNVQNTWFWSDFWPPRNLQSLILCLLPYGEGVRY